MGGIKHGLGVQIYITNAEKTWRKMVRQALHDGDTWALISELVREKAKEVLEVTLGTRKEGNETW